jgi:hypothetical protein
MQTVRIVYVLHQSAGDYPARFISSYNEHPPGIEHESIVVLNDLKATTEIQCLFSSLRNVRFLERDNSGADIGAYQHASRAYPSDFMMFFGTSSYFKRPGWLLQMLQAFLKHGDTLYGTTANRGSGAIQPHIRTTGFAISSSLLNKHPVHVTDVGRHGPRYEWEHGKTGLSSWIKSRGLSPLLVCWNGVYREPEWDSVTNGFHRGDQSALLCGDRLCTRPYFDGE